jgi:hypothetical protein
MTLPTFTAINVPPSISTSMAGELLFCQVNLPCSTMVKNLIFFVKVVFTPGKEAGFNRPSKLVRLFCLNEEKPEPWAFTGHLQ